MTAATSRTWVALTVRMALTVAAAAAIAAWVAGRSDWASLLDSIRRVPAWAIAAVVGVGCANMLLLSVKWKVLLPSYPILPMVRLTFASLFYGFVLNGQLAGEAAKAYFLGRGRRDAETVAASVVVDRLAGLCGLLVMGLAGVAFSGQAPRGVTASLVVGILATTVVFLSARPLRSLARRLAGPVRPIGSIRAAALHRFESFLESWERYRGRPASLCGAVLLGVVCQSLGVGATWFIAGNLGIENVSFWDWSWVFALVSLAVMAPLTIGGLGLREGSFVGALSLLHVPSERALALALTMSAIQAAMATIGGLTALATHRGRMPTARDARTDTSLRREG